MKRVVLAQVADPQRGVMDHLTFFQLLLSQQHPQEGRFSSPVSADESDFDIINQRQLGVVQQKLVTVSFLSLSDLDQNCHCNQFREEERMDLSIRMM